MVPAEQSLYSSWKFFSAPALRAGTADTKYHFLFPSYTILTVTKLIWALREVSTGRGKLSSKCTQKNTITKLCTFLE